MPGSKDIRAIMKNLDQAYAKTPLLSPLEQLIFATIADGLSNPMSAIASIKRVNSTFVDWNEARVARRAELARLMDEMPEADERAEKIRVMLNRLFELRGAMDLSFLNGLKPAEARRLLIELNPEISRPVVSMILYELCPGSTIPITPEGLRVARKYGFVSRAGTKHQLQNVLESNLEQNEAARVTYYCELEASGGIRAIGKVPKSTARKRKKK